MVIKELCNYCIVFHSHLELYSNTSLRISLYSDIMKVTDSNCSCRVSTVTMLAAGNQGTVFQFVAQAQKCPPTLLFRTSSRVKHSWYEADCPPKPGAESKNVWSHTPVPHALKACTWTTFQAHYLHLNTACLILLFPPAQSLSPGKFVNSQL